MALTLIRDLASQVSNSYCTLEFANNYWQGDYRAQLSTQWAALSDPQKTSALIAGCRVIEQVRFTVPTLARQWETRYNYRTQMVMSYNIDPQPSRYQLFQNLQFPRNIDVYYLNMPADVTPPDGYAPGMPYIPEEIMSAQCEQAVFLLNFDDGVLAEQVQGIVESTTTLGKGDVTITREYGSRGLEIAPRALSLIKPFIVRNGGVRRG